MESREVSWEIYLAKDCYLDQQKCYTDKWRDEVPLNFIGITSPTASMKIDFLWIWPHWGFQTLHDQNIWLLLVYSITGQKLWNNQFPFLSPGGQQQWQPVCFHLSIFKVRFSSHKKSRRAWLWMEAKQCGCCGSGARIKMPGDMGSWEVIQYSPVYCSCSDHSLSKMPQDRSAGRAITKCWLRLCLHWSVSYVRLLWL